MRVLIVDDEPLDQTALANILSARSDVEHFDSANDASEALKKFRIRERHRFDCSTDKLDLTARPLRSYPEVIFMRFRGPQRP